MSGIDAKYVIAQPDLGEVARNLGGRLSGWGQASGSQQASCAMGRAGLAVFPDGTYPAMMLWVTASGGAALMWTWLGPDLMADQIREALAIVLSARLRE